MTNIDRVDYPSQIRLGNDKTRILELTNTVRNLEQAYDIKRREAGDYYDALLHADPAAAKRFTRDTNPSRYLVLDRLISLAAEIGTNHHTLRDGGWRYWNDTTLPELLDQLAEAVDHHQNYWTHIQEIRDRKKQSTEAARTTRTKNRATSH